MFGLMNHNSGRDCIYRVNLNALPEVVSSTSGFWFSKVVPIYLKSRYGSIISFLPSRLKRTRWVASRVASRLLKGSSRRRVALKW